MLRIFAGVWAVFIIISIILIKRRPSEVKMIDIERKDSEVSVSSSRSEANRKFSYITNTYSKVAFSEAGNSLPNE